MWGLQRSEAWQGWCREVGMLERVRAWTGVVRQRTEDLGSALESHLQDLGLWQGVQGKEEVLRGGEGEKEREREREEGVMTEEGQPRGEGLRRGEMYQRKADGVWKGEELPKGGSQLKEEGVW